MQDFLNYLKFQKNYSDHTILNYELDLNKLNEFLKLNNYTLNNLNYKNINEFIIYLKDLKLNTNSINRILSASRSFFSYLERNKRVKNNPFNLVNSLKKDKVLPNYFKYNDFIEMINSIDLSNPLGVRNRALIELLLATGARIGEVVNIKCNDVYLSLGEIRVLGKGNKERIVYLNDYAIDAIDNYLNSARNVLLKKDCDYLFLNHLGGRLTDRGVRMVIESIIKKTSLNIKVTPHSFRHSFATMLLTEGCDLKSVQELLGHVNMSTTSIYTHLSNEQIKNVYLYTHPRSKQD